MRLSALFCLALLSALTLAFLDLLSHKHSVNITISPSTTAAQPTGQPTIQDSVAQNDQEQAAEADGLTEDAVKKATFCVNHHPIIYYNGYSAVGGTRVAPTFAGEDNLHCWTSGLEEIKVGDLNGDGVNDAVALVSFAPPYKEEYHLVPFLNENGEAVQVGDLMITGVFACSNLSIEPNGEIVADLSSETQPHHRHCKFKLVNKKLVAIQTEQTQTRECSLTVNENDVLLPHPSFRYADMISRGAVIKTGIRTNRITKSAVQEALRRQQRRLEIADDFSGCGKIQQIAFGDFTGDGRQDAAIIVGTERADNTQLDLIPVVLEKGQLILYGVVPLGGGGFDTWDEKLAIKSGLIKVRIKVGEKFQPPPAQPWISWHFKVRKGKLQKYM